MSATLGETVPLATDVQTTEPASKDVSNPDDALGPIIDRKGKTLSEEQLAIFQRYTHWRANLMCLYNHIECYALPYPARTVRFLPNARNLISSENQYPRYTNYPFLYPSHCYVPKQDKNGVATAAQQTTPATAAAAMHTQATSASASISLSSCIDDSIAIGTAADSSHTRNAAAHSSASASSDSDDDQDGVSATKMTPVYYLQSMHYFTANRIEEQTALWTLFHRNRAQTHIDLGDLHGIRQTALTTGILPFDAYMHSGPSVESAYDVYRLRIMPQQPHLVATRSYHEDVAIYWFDYEHAVSPLDAFDKLRQATQTQNQNAMPERSGLTHSDDEESDAEHDDDGTATKRGRKRAHSHNHSSRQRQDEDDTQQPPTKRAKLRHIRRQQQHLNNGHDDGDGDGDGKQNGNDDEDDDEDDEDDDNLMQIEVGGAHAYLIAVGQTSLKTRIGWALAFNPQHAGLFVTGNNDGSIACWDLNMVDNAQCMNKMGKYRNKKNSADPSHYMKQSKIQQPRTFGDGPPFISQQRSDEYLWFEEFERYGVWSNTTHAMNQQYTNLDVTSVDWCADSSQVFVSCSANGQISIWDRRNKTGKKKPALWTWGTSHNQAIMSVAWNPIQHSLLASGDKSKHVRIWDIRAFNRHCVQLAQHDACVYHVQWCPYNKFLLASSGADNTVLMYDLRRSGMNNPNQKQANETSPSSSSSSETHTDKKMSDKTTPQEMDSMQKLLESLSTNQVGNSYDASCPELVFAHCGHTACIPEFDWCPSDDLTMISTDMDGIIHTWQPPSGMLNTFAWVLNSQTKST